MSKLIQKHFDRSTATYKEAAIIQKKIARICCSRVPQGTYSRILEIGAGGGLLTQACADRLGRHLVYAALDLSTRMLRLLPEGAASLIRGDGEKAPFKAESFDLVISSSAMQWYGGRAESILGSINLVKKGGLFSLAFFVEGTFPQMKQVSSLTGFGSMYPLPGAEACIRAFAKAGHDFQWEVEEHTAYFASVPHFLRAHKQTGATYTRSGALFGKKALRDFCRSYEDLYLEEKGIPVGYRVLYLWGKTR